MLKSEIKVGGIYHTSGRLTMTPTMVRVDRIVRVKPVESPRGRAHRTKGHTRYDVTVVEVGSDSNGKTFSFGTAKAFRMEAFRSDYSRCNDSTRLFRIEADYDAMEAVKTQAKALADEQDRRRKANEEAGKLFVGHLLAIGQGGYWPK